MSKQTAVDKIIKFCEKRINISVSSHIGAYKDIIEFCKQAKAMEKEQIEKAFEVGYNQNYEQQYDTIEQYYQETYGGNHIVDTNEMIDHIGDANKMVEISDEEIKQYAKQNAFNYYEFISGAKWYREQLKRGNNE